MMRMQRRSFRIAMGLAAAVALSGGFALPVTAGSLDSCCFGSPDNASCVEDASQFSCDNLGGVLVNENLCQNINCDDVLAAAAGDAAPAPAASAAVLTVLAAGMALAGSRAVRRRRKSI